MAPEQYKAVAEATARRSSAAAGASSHSAEEPEEARAPLRWPFTSRRQQERALQRRAAANESPSASESEEVSDNEGLQSDGWRERDQTEHLNSSDEEGLPPAPAPAQQPAVQEQVPSGPETLPRPR